MFKDRQLQFSDWFYLACKCFKIH